MIRHEIKDGDAIDEVVADGVEWLRKRGVVGLIPTETVYGLICAWDDAVARERIYRMKGRGWDKPLQALVASSAQLEAFEIEPFPALTRAIETFCPGPITIVVQAGDGKVGFRVPDHPFCLSLLSGVGPCAATSANRSGRPTPKTIDEVLGQLTAPPDWVVDAGPTSMAAKASTVVEIRPDRFTVIRPGPITERQLEEGTGIFPG